MVRDSILRDTLDYVIGRDGVERVRTYTYRRRWRRTMLQVSTGGMPSFRYHVRVGRWWVRMPWVAWAMFS